MFFLYIHIYANKKTQQKDTQNKTNSLPPPPKRKISQPAELSLLQAPPPGHWQCEAALGYPRNDYGIEEHGQSIWCWCHMISISWKMVILNNYIKSIFNIYLTHARGYLSWSHQTILLSDASPTNSCNATNTTSKWSRATIESLTNASNFDSENTD